MLHNLQVTQRISSGRSGAIRFPLVTQLSLSRLRDESNVVFTVWFYLRSQIGLEWGMWAPACWLLLVWRALEDSVRLCDRMSVCIWGVWSHEAKMSACGLNLLWWVYAAVTIVHISNITLLSSAEFLSD